MRSHAKASTAGSTQRQATGLGRIFRGALATRGASSRTPGSGAPAVVGFVPLALVAILLALVLVPPAGAVTGRTIEGEFPPAFTGATGLAVDPVSKDVLVIDRTASTVSRWHPDGTPSNFSALGTNVIDAKGSGPPCTPPSVECDGTPQNGFVFELGVPNNVQVAVAPPGAAAGTAGNIYVTQGSSDLIAIFSEDGEYLGQLTEAGTTDFGEPCGVAVDDSGAIYVGDFSEPTDPVHKFVPSANPPVNADHTISFSSLEGPSRPCTLAAGTGPTAGFIFVNRLQGELFKLDSSTGALQYGGAPITTNGRTVTVDRETGNVVVAKVFNVEEYDASGPVSARLVWQSDSFATGVFGVAAFGDLYTSLFTSPHLRVFGPLEVLPPQLNDEWTESVGTTEAVLKVRFGKEEEETTFRVEYGLDTSYGQSTSQRAVGSTSTVSITLSGLQPGSTYHWRIVATNPDGDVTEGSDNTFTTHAPPTSAGCPNEALRTGPSAALPDCRAYEMVTPVEKAGADAVTQGTEFTFDQGAAAGDKLAYSSYRAFGDAAGAPYITTYLATRGAEGWASRGISAPQGSTTVTSTAPPLHNPFKAFSPDLSTAWFLHEAITPLTDDSIEHYRNLYRYDIAADSYAVLSTVEPPNVVAGDYFLEFQGSSSDGSRAIFITNDALTPEAPAGGEGKQILYGWSGGEPNLLGVMPSGEASPLNSSAGVAEGGKQFGAERFLDHAISKDGSRVFWTNFATTTSGRTGHLYLRVNGDQPQSAQAHGSATGTGDINATTAFALLEEGSASIFYLFPSGSFSVGDPIAGPGIPAGATIVAVNELNPFEGQLEISAPATETVFGGEIASASKTITNLTASTGAFAVGQTIKGDGIPSGTTVSAVGANTLTLSAAPSKAGTGVELEAFSECTEPAKACTIPVSESVSAAEAQFWGASTDGSKAIFTINETLGGVGAAPGALYEFDVATQTPTLIANKAMGVMGTSDDAAHVYFASSEDLDAGATLGEPNLYHYHAGTFSFIATLPNAESQSFGVSANAPRPLWVEPVYHAARVTPDGRHAAFVSRAALTGYDNSAATGGGAAAEVYHYDADADELTCASCNPSGARPLAEEISGGNRGSQLYPVAATIFGWKNNIHDGRNLSNDGNRLFFESFDELVPQDTNGAWDVYQWEANGSGDCQREGGCISLISTGKSPADSEFIDASTSGDDVFIRTESSIDPRDPGLVDIYDARVGGGYPYLAPPDGCIGDACQSPREAPNDPTPASASFRGAGDPAPRKAARRCRARKRQGAKQTKQAKRKQAKRCKRAKRGAGR